MGFSIIACVGRKLELGVSGGLVWQIPEDMKFFRSQTMGHKVVMGSRTYRSLPPAGLPGREVLVLTRKKDIKMPHTSIISNFDEFVKSIRGEEVFVIGGASVYEQFLPYVSTMYLTEVDAEEPGADVYFPEFDASLFSRKEIGGGEFEGLKYKFVKYTRKEFTK